MVTNTIITLLEHEYIQLGEETNLKTVPKTLEKKEFKELQEFIFSTPTDSDTTNKINNWRESIKNENADYYLQYFVRNQREYIKAKNYVGIIFLKSGTTIEILPKTAKDKITCRKDLLNIFSILTKSTSLLSGTANLDVAKLPIFEHFIRMFITEVQHLAKCGFRSKYLEEESNEHVFKGKLLISEQIKYNLTHAERFYVCYDDYNINRPINRLIKATLQLLLRKTTNWKNKKDINRLIDLLDPVATSTNYETDIANVDLDRNTKEFGQIFEWCKVFLRKKSFTSLSGNVVADALLFNMNKLFEDYVATMLKKYRRDITVQATGEYLFDEPEMQRFPLRPDIIVRNSDEHPLVLDTKWKLLDNDAHWISQQDMYQMYAYHKKYVARKVILIYPEQDHDKIPTSYIAQESEHNGEKVTIELRFVRLSWNNKEWEDFVQYLDRDNIEWEEYIKTQNLIDNDKQEQ